MINLTLINNLLNFRNELLDCKSFEIQDEFVLINVINEENDCFVLFEANETTINGILQTSAQMIFDTLSNGKS